MEKFFTKRDYADAELILNQLSVQTNCFDETGKLRAANYLVCIDDDVTSAFYAVDLYYQIFQTYHYRPMILCVGGVGPLSKYTNTNGESEGDKLERVCMALGVPAQKICVLDAGTNTGLNCLDLYKKMQSNIGISILCLTKRLSLRIKQTFEFLDFQYQDQVESDTLMNILSSMYYYVPEDTIQNMMQMYNCKGLCKGSLLLAEIASIYDRIDRYSGTLQKPLDFTVSSDVVAASKRLAKKYPLKINVFCFNGIWQFLWAYYAVWKNKEQIKSNMSSEIQKYRRQLREVYNV